jgi:hypothetical protein
MIRKINPPVRALSMGLLLALALVPAANAQPVAKTAQAEAGDEVVLPSRVAAGIRRTSRALDKAEELVDSSKFPRAITALRAVRRNMYRSHRAANRQVDAPPPPEDAEGEPVIYGPDSVVAVLGLDHTVVVTVAGLFDMNSKGVVDALTHATFRTMSARDRMLDKVIALDPEGAGAGYADVMADTLADYQDEVDNLGEALQDDQLSAGGRRVLTEALAKSQATQAKAIAAFGGGE